MSGPEPFPWDEAMALGLGTLRWSPDQFWRASPRELMAAAGALGGPPAPEPARTSDLLRLMGAFPDEG